MWKVVTLSYISSNKLFKKYFTLNSMILLFINMAVESLGLITCICNLNGKAFFSSQYNWHIIWKYYNFKDIIFSYDGNLKQLVVSVWVIT